MTEITINHFVTVRLKIVFDINANVIAATFIAFTYIFSLLVFTFTF